MPTRKTPQTEDIDLNSYSTNGITFDLSFYSYRFTFAPPPHATRYGFNFMPDEFTQRSNPSISGEKDAFKIEIEFVRHQNGPPSQETGLLRFFLVTNNPFERIIIANDIDPFTFMRERVFPRFEFALTLWFRLNKDADTMDITCSLNSYILFQTSTKALNSRFCSTYAVGKETFASLHAERVNDYVNMLIAVNTKKQHKRLDLSNCGLQEIPKEIGVMDWLEELIIGSGSYFDYDTGKYVSTANKAHENSISYLPLELSGLRSLKTLVIALTKGSFLTREDLWNLKVMRQLRFLCIVNAGLTDIRLLSDLPKLQILYLFDNQLSDITPLAELHSLEILRIRGNKITDISPLANLKHLRVLRFGKNQVRDLQPLSGLYSLEDLSFYSNAVNDIQPLEHLTRLKKLVFRDNKVSSLDSLYALQQIEWMDFRNNQVDNIPPFLTLPKCKRLLFRKNNITSIQPLADWPALEELGFAENNVSDINVLRLLLKLTELDCGGNQIKDITALSYLVNLKKIYLRKNPVHEVVSLALLHLLQELDITDTNVSDIRPLTGAAKLQKLYFENSPVIEIAPLTEMVSLQKFNAMRCPVFDCPADVYEPGDPQQLRAYFEATNSYKKAIEQAPSQHTSRRDVKLIILGNSNTGKTNFVHYLQTGLFTGERQSSHGLEVKRWNPDPARFPQLKNITVSIWDFGGQEYYHEAYKLFLSANAIYLLFWCNEYNINGRRPTILNTNEAPVELEHFEMRYWLDTIKYYGGATSEAAVIVAQNKMDEPKDKRRITQEIHDEYNISDSFHISLQLGADAANVRHHASLTHFVSELEQAISTASDKASAPPHWQEIRNDVIALKSKRGKNRFSTLVRYDLFIHLDEFIDACNSGIDEALSQNETYTIPRWLNTGGVIVFFPDIPSLANKVFIKPEVLAKTIYEVLSKDVLSKGGEFAINDIMVGKDGAVKAIFLDIAAHLQLIFPHPTKGPDHYIAPQYLPDSHVIEDLYTIASRGLWKSSFWIKVPLFYYKRLLHGLLLHYATSSQSECRYFWKHGVLFSRQQQGALIKGLYPSENENEGVIVMSVDRETYSYPDALHTEIFNVILGLLKITPPEEDPIGILTSVSNELQVSYDGKNFATYSDLLNSREEPKIKACNSSHMLLMKKFDSLLPFNTMQAKKVFLSYSHKDTDWLNRLRAHLSGLRRSNKIESWDDKELLPGDVWDETIKRNLEEADVYIMLLSADFVASDYIWNVEFKTAIEKFSKRGAIIIPVLCEPFDLGSHTAITKTTDGNGFKLGDFEITPKTEQGGLLAMSSWTNKEEALKKVTEQIRKVIDR